MNRLLWSIIIRCVALLCVFYAVPNAHGHLTDPCSINNNLLTHTENGRQIVRKYDGLNRLTNCVDEAGNNSGAEYDNNGNLTRLIYPGATAWVKYRYDSLNHLTNMVDWLGHTVNYQYDIAGRLTNVARHNQTSRRLAYDAANRLTNIAELGPGVTNIASWAITPDEAGRTRSVTVTPTAVNRMEQSRSMTFDDDNRLSKFRDLRVSYDDAGNLTKGPLTLLGGLVNFAYDARNRLTGTDPHLKRCEWVQRHLLYLGEINDSQKAACTKVVDIFDTEEKKTTELALYPAGHPVPECARLWRAGAPA